MRDFDITGFVHFPLTPSQSMRSVNSGETHVYLVSFGEKSEFYSPQGLSLPGIFCGDDTTPVAQLRTDFMEIDQIINHMKVEENMSNLYFSDGEISVPLFSCTLIGWSKFSYEYVNRLTPWCCSFKDLTEEGRKFYYALKKLHNEKETRILTFNNIKK